MTLTLTITAKDGATTQIVLPAPTINVAGMPVVTPINFTVPTNPPKSGTLGTLVATNSPTSFAIVSGDPNHYFAIGPHHTTVVGPVPPDGIYNLMVTASNAVGTSAAVPITVTVGKAIVLAPTTFTPQLPVTAGQVIGQAVASGGTPVSWAITLGNASGYFAISNTGTISVTAAGVAGLAALTTYSLTIQATNAFGTVSSVWKVSPLSVPIGPPPSGQQWHILPNGGGGLIGGMSMAADNTLIFRTDTMGAYVWNAGATSPIGTAGSWTQMCSGLTMPTDYIDGAAGATHFGVFEVRVCYNSSNVMYMTWVDVESSGASNSTVFKSINQGVSWTRCPGFTPVNTGNCEPNDVTRIYGPRMAIDPNNSNKVYVGTLAGLQLTTDGGTTFNAVSTGAGGIPLTTGVPGYTGMCISAANSNNIFIASFGHGIYGSTNGSTFSQLAAGGPTQVNQAQIDESTGAYYVVGGDGNVYKYLSGAWTTIYTSGGNPANGIAIDPNNSGHVAITFGGGGMKLWDGSTLASSGGSTTSGDVGWIGDSTANITLYPEAWFDRTAPNTIYSCSDRGTWIATWTGSLSGATVNWAIRARGHEQLVGLDVISASGHPVCSAWDFGTRYVANFTSYPSVYGPLNNTGFTATWSMDIALADGSNLIACLSDGEGFGFGSPAHASSTDGGQTWTLYTPPYATVGGNIAVSTSQKWLFGGSQSSGSQQPYYTINGGSSWNPIAISGVSNWSGLGTSYSTPGRWLCADKVNAGHYTIMWGGIGFYKSTDNGVTWTGPTSSSFALEGGAQMKSVPTQANHLWVSDGGFQSQPGGFGIPTNGPGLVAYSTDAGVTFTQVTNMEDAYSIGFGAPQGGSYPTVFVAGHTSFACTGSATVPGSFPTTITLTLTGTPGHILLPGAAVTLIDSGAARIMRGSLISNSGGTLTVSINMVNKGSGSSSTWVAYIYGVFETTGGPSATPTWIQIGAPAIGNSLDIVQNIEGDMNIAGRCYVALGGSGFMYYG